MPGKRNTTAHAAAGRGYLSRTSRPILMSSRTSIKTRTISTASRLAGRESKTTMTTNRGSIRDLRIWLVATCTVATVAALTPGFAAAGSGGGTLCVLQAELTPGSETTGSTSAATGTTRITVGKDGTIEQQTRIVNPANETFVAGHIHEAPAGDDGPVVVPLYGAPDPPTSARQIRIRGVVTPNAGTTGEELCQSPSAYYVNFHTAEFTGGAIRGQLHH